MKRYGITDIVPRIVLVFFAATLVLAGCATPPPPVPAPSAQTLSFKVDLNTSGKVTTQWTTSKGNTYLGFYRIVLNNLNTSLIGNQTAVTTSPDTWTDYFELNNGGWIRNDRIAPPNSQQPQQWTGPQPITPGTISGGGTTFTIALSLPDPYLGEATQFNVSVITYVANQNNPAALYPIDSLGPPISASAAIQYMSFNKTVSNPDTIDDPLGDWATYPANFPDLTTSDYQNFDISAFTVQVQ